MLDQGEDVAWQEGLLISRRAARRITDGYRVLHAKLGDLQGLGSEAVMVFDPLIEPATGRYLTDIEAFCHRWRDLGGRVAGGDVGAMSK
jgi:hypothetical protein